MYRAAFIIIGLVLLVLMLCAGSVAVLKWISPSTPRLTSEERPQYLLFTRWEDGYCIWGRFDEFMEARDIEQRLNALWHDRRTFYVTDTKRLTPPYVPQEIL